MKRMGGKVNRRVRNNCICVCAERGTCMGFGRSGISTSCNEEKNFSRGGGGDGFFFISWQFVFFFFCMAIYVPFVLNTHISRKVIEIEVSYI